MSDLGPNPYAGLPPPPPNPYAGLPPPPAVPDQRTWLQRNGIWLYRVLRVGLAVACLSFGYDGGRELLATIGAKNSAATITAIDPCRVVNSGNDTKRICLVTLSNGTSTLQQDLDVGHAVGDEVDAIADPAGHLRAVGTVLSNRIGGAFNLVLAALFGIAAAFSRRVLRLLDSVGRRRRASNLR